MFVTDSGSFPTEKGESGSSPQKPLLLRTAAGKALQLGSCNWDLVIGIS